MALETSQISVKTTADTDIIDITPLVWQRIESSSIHEGSIVLFVPGSTGALTTIEYESGVIEDLKNAIDRMAPEELFYKHNERWGDGNGYSHVRAALLGPSITVPIMGGRLMLGTWQQIVLLDFDNRPREREIILQLSGE